MPTPPVPKIDEILHGLRASKVYNSDHPFEGPIVDAKEEAKQRLEALIAEAWREGAIEAIERLPRARHKCGTSALAWKRVLQLQGKRFIKGTHRHSQLGGGRKEAV